MEVKLFLVLVAVISLFESLDAAARIKPKDYDQKMSAASYYYRTEHVEPPHSFVTGNSYPSKSGYYTAATDGFVPPVGSYSNSKIDQPSGGTYSYVSSHGGSSGSSSGGGSSSSSSSGGGLGSGIESGLGLSSPIVHQTTSDTLPLHRPVSVEVNDDGEDEEAAVSQEVLSEGDVGAYDGDTEVEGSYEVAPLSSGGGDYSHGTFHHDHSGGDHGSSYSKGGKDSHGSEYYSRKGHKGNKSYDKAHKEAQGKQGKYDNANEAGHYADNGGKKASHFDEGSQYASNNEEGYKKSGGKHGEKKHHKKGSKTTGFHNVYHKDEYKKDHTFYDENDHQGHFSKHGEQEKKHHADEGAYKKGGHHDSAYKDGHHKKQGSQSSGHIDEKQKKFKNKHGYNKHYNDQQGYGKKHGESGHEEEGYEEGHDHGHY